MFEVLLLSYLIPWEPSLPLVVLFIAGIALYIRGTLRRRVSIPRQASFWIGVVILYLSLHTRLDYYAEHEFFIHRIQHLILHHLAPLILMAGFPGAVMWAGLPLRTRMRLRAFGRRPAMRAVSAVVLNPTLVTLSFIAAVLIWLVPSIQFVSMLDWRLYHFMNWSVTITGLLYWGMLLDHRPAPPARMKAGLRVLSPAITMTPQILAGAYITFSQHDLYPVFDLCGRAFGGITQTTDQTIGGLVMWVPAALLEAIGGLIALRNWMQLSSRNRLPQPRRRTPARAPARGGPSPSGSSPSGSTGSRAGTADADATPAAVMPPSPAAPLPVSPSPAQPNVAAAVTVADGPVRSRGH
jgi:putative membrane protein